MSLTQENVVREYVAAYGRPPTWLVRVPGRVNLIGEHTDYSDGFVLPMAIDRAVWIAMEPTGDGRVAIRSTDFGESAEFSLADFHKQGAGWIEYVKGTAWSLQQAGCRLTGFRGVLQGDVPQGAGLSSSAALEVAVARAFAAASDIPWHAEEMALVAQLAENGWVGVQCGIMDQLISPRGQAGCAVCIDCRSLELQAVALPPGVAVAILDTLTRRGLVGSAYNERRAGLRGRGQGIRRACPARCRVARLPGRGGLARRDDAETGHGT